MRYVGLIFALMLTRLAWAQAPTITAGPNFGTYSIGAIDLPLTASGGSAPYSWEIEAGRLPDGLYLRADSAPYSSR